MVVTLRSGTVHDVTDTKGSFTMFSRVSEPDEKGIFFGSHGENTSSVALEAALFLELRLQFEHLGSCPVPMRFPKRF
jgi:hypothetical protein